jgi:hypothetical protein
MSLLSAASRAMRRRLDVHRNARSFVQFGVVGSCAVVPLLSSVNTNTSGTNTVSTKTLCSNSVHTKCSPGMTQNRPLQLGCPAASGATASANTRLTVSTGTHNNCQSNSNCTVSPWSKTWRFPRVHPHRLMSAATKPHGAGGKGKPKTSPYYHPQTKGGMAPVPPRAVHVKPVTISEPEDEERERKSRMHDDKEPANSDSVRNAIIVLLLSGIVVGMYFVQTLVSRLVGIGRSRIPAEHLLFGVQYTHEPAPSSAGSSAPSSASASATTKRNTNTVFELVVTVPDPNDTIETPARVPAVDRKIEWSPEKLHTIISAPQVLLGALKHTPNWTVTMLKIFGRSTAYARSPWTAATIAKEGKVV